MKSLKLNQEELAEIAVLLGAIRARFDRTEHQSFLDEVTLYAHQLPYRVRKLLNDFKLGRESSGLCMVSGYAIDDAKIGATPRHWAVESDGSSSIEERMFHHLCAALLGDVFGWSTQQNGRITHDVFPIPAYENEQLGFSSKESLTWHTEDAFHDYRPDFVALMCLRNPDGIGTHCGIPDYAKLSRQQIECLFEPNFVIRPDNSHLAINNSPDRATKTTLLASAFEDMEKLRVAPRKMSVFFGSRSDPYLRIDPYFMEQPSDPRALNALQALIRAIDDDYQEYPMRPGDVLFINNLRVVHGRKSFAARYDGTDRWLKRLLIVRDLAKSRDRRSDDFSRVIS